MPAEWIAWECVRGWYIFCLLVPLRPTSNVRARPSIRPEGDLNPSLAELAKVSKKRKSEGNMWINECMDQHHPSLFANESNQSDYGKLSRNQNFPKCYLKFTTVHTIQTTLTVCRHNLTGMYHFPPVIRSSFAQPRSNSQTIDSLLW
jgi:hypothetical protein